MATDDEDIGLEVVTMGTKGRGVYIATKPFKNGDFVVEYAGDIIDINCAKDRELKYSEDSTIGSYMLYFKTNKKSFCVDATCESGRIGRLINHSRLVPNLRAKVYMMGENPRVILVANRDIPIGTEVQYDYNDTNKESIKEHPWLAL